MPADEMQTNGMLTESRRDSSVTRRGLDGRFLPSHGRYVGLRRPKRPDRRRSLVRQAEALRDAYALAKGFPSWTSCPGPVAALIEAAVELRLLRRALVRSLWAGQEVPKRYEAIAELERRVLATLGIEHAAGPDVAALLAAMRQEEQR